MTWIFAQQAEFFRALSGAVRAARADGSAVWTLLALSFAYGVFHAAGPGHGKAVISSYLVATGETWKRGVILSFASALLQSVVAIALVGIAVFVINATARSMTGTVQAVEIVSFALIALVGARLTWVKGRAFLAAWRGRKAELLHHSHAGHHHHGEEPHVHGPGCDHSHAPEPAHLHGRHWLREGLATIVATGARPCSGAILVLVFAASQGMFAAGAAATLVMGLGTALTVAAIAILAVSARKFFSHIAHARPGGGMILLRALETAAAVAVLAFGLLLLAGYIASERLGF